MASACKKTSVHFAEGTDFPSPSSIDGTGDFQGNIDPSLDNYYSPHLMAGQWSHQQQAMQQYLGDDQKTAYFHLPQATQPFHHNSAVCPVPVMPAASQPRYTSPFSYHAPSSTCSSALSPPGGSDCYYDGNMPSTPTEYNLVASTPKGLLAEIQPHHSFFQFTGMATHLPGEGCVNLSEVNPNQELPTETLSNDGNPFEYNPRSYSYHSYTSQCELDYASQQGPADFEMKRASSPEEIGPAIKDEIRIPDDRPAWGCSYPPPHPEDEYPSSAEEIVTKKMKREPDDDYKPGKRPTKRRTQSAPIPRKQQGRPKAKRLAASRPQMDVTDRKAPLGSIPSTAKRLSCSECHGHERFRNGTELQNHMNRKHNRHFRCVFDFAGCFSTFSSKNEWKRHVMSQHIVLIFWLCTQDACSEVANGPNAEAGPCLPNGSIFNRKDLYTQHLRRMHSPESIKLATKALQKKTAAIRASSATAANQDEVQRYEDSLRNWQREAETKRCELPTHMNCPSVGCGQTFEGGDAWDQRMEHVAKHLQREARGGEDAGRVKFGGESDAALVEWASRPDVAVIRKVVYEDGSGERWVLNNRLTSASSGAGGSCGPASSGGGSRGSRVVPRVMSSNTVVVGGGSEDVDAEGEEE